MIQDYQIKKILRFFWKHKNTAKVWIPELQVHGKPSEPTCLNINKNEEEAGVSKDETGGKTIFAGAFRGPFQILEEHPKSNKYTCIKLVQSLYHLETVLVFLSGLFEVECDLKE